MKQPDARDTPEITAYHAHIYYDVATTRHLAELLRTRIGERFVVYVGRWHDELVGPHTSSMYQIAFDVDKFDQLVPWLMLNRMGLNILVHPNTDSPYDDHVINGLWLGDKLPIKTDVLEHSLKAEGKDPEIVTVNSKPTISARVS